MRMEKLSSKMLHLEPRKGREVCYIRSKIKGEGGGYYKA